MKLQDRRIAAAVIVVWLLAVFAGGRLFWSAAYAALALVALAWLWVRRAPERLDCGIVAEQAYAEAGGQVKVQVWLEHEGFLPLPWVEVHEDPQTARLPLGYLHMGAGIGLADSVMHFLWLQTPRRGVYTVGPLRLRTGDPFGLFSYEWNAAGEVTVTVLPRVVHLPALPVPLTQPFGHRRVRQRAFEDPTSPATLRPYAPGDSPRHVHWKAVAHTGELMTREFDLLATTRLSIWLDARPCAGFETGVEVAAALLDVAVRTRLEVELTSFAPGRLHLEPGRGDRQLRRGLELLARVEPAHDIRLEAAMAVAHSPGRPTLAIISGCLDDGLAARLLTRADRILLVLVPGAPVAPERLAALARRLTVYRLREGDLVEALPERRVEVMPLVR
ncbi:MAG TPA: DUF58 domain-containing protein [Symbiobacteriaceae bacterium]|nr:DUF58 domain-containing protein [Symbiobacteriaceae bacterium]